MSRRCLPVTLCLILTLLFSLVEPKPEVTEEELTLLSEDLNVPHCFSRNLETVVCYWEAEELLNKEGAGLENFSFGFYYSTNNYDKKSEEECDLSVQPGRRTLYVCEHDEVVLFTNLNVFVRDKITNRILRNRKFELEFLTIFQHPYDIKVKWEEGSDRFRVTWKRPKTDVYFMLKYEVQFWSSEEQRQSVIIEEVNEALLLQLKPSLLYYVRVRTSWKGEKPSIWGPWSEAVTFTSPKLAETIGLWCFTPDLSQVCCNWDEKLLDATFFQVQYRYGQKSTSIWLPCNNSLYPRKCNCVFPGRKDSDMSMVVNVTFVDGKQGLFYNQPFQINHVVLPSAPDLHVQQLPGNKLALNWSSPILGLEKQLIYKIRFSTDNEKSWTIVQVPAGAHEMVISMVSDASYTLQIQASPNQKEIRGYWSEWSAKVTTKSLSSTVWVTPVIIVSSLLILSAGLCLPCIFPSFYRKLKNKLWPTLPNLHRVLDTFLAEIQKQYQPNSTLYEKPLEEVAQPSYLEILCELTPTCEGQQVSRDYVQLAPPSYQNEEHWPNLEPLELNRDPTANSQLPCGLTNQTYLPTGWSLQ